MASLTKRNKVWYLYWYQDGKKHGKKLSSDRQTALEYKAEFENKLYRKELGLVDRNLSWQTFTKEYLEYSKANKRPKTYKIDKSTIDNFTKIINPSKLSVITPIQIEKWKQTRLNSVSQTSVNIEIRHLKSAFNKAIQWKYIITNPFKDIKQLKIPQKAPVFLTKEEIPKLLSICEEPLYSIVKTFIYTGLRLSELINLRWEDVNFKNHHIIIQAHDDWQPKDYQLGAIPLHKELEIILKSKPKNNIYVFSNNGNNKLNKDWLRKQFKKVIKKAGIKKRITPHTLRHTFASHLAMNGIDLLTIKELLRHSDYKTTLIYAHLSQPHMDKAIEKLDF